MSIYKYQVIISNLFIDWAFVFPQQSRSIVDSFYRAQVVSNKILYSIFFYKTLQKLMLYSTNNSFFKYYFIDVVKIYLN